MAEQMAAVHSRIQAALDAHHEAAAALTSALSVVSAGAPLAQQFRGLTEMFAGEVVSLLRQLEGHRAGLLSGAKPIGSVAIGEAAPGGQIEEAA
jgi:hypothetical protein